jgi:hypothetical protein
VSKEIWLGPLLGNNRSRLIERCSDLVAEGKADTFLYLAASHPLLEIVTERILDGARNRGLWGELPVYLFRGFVRQILLKAVDTQTGERLAPRIPIDSEELPLKRSLVSQILKRLTAAGELKAIGPLAHREGCINTIATLIGEIERAAKTPAEVAKIVADRATDQTPGTGGPSTVENDETVYRQVDFDREVALIYATYSDLLDCHQFTEADADQLRALKVLGGELDGRNWKIPTLSNVQLLVLDGFFDFTPVQGEILQRLIPQIPEVIVNLNHDQRNPEIFVPFKETIERLSAIAPFEVVSNPGEIISTSGALAGLRQHLFNPSVSEKLQFVGEVSEEPSAQTERPPLDDVAPKSTQQSEIRYFECGDRETEIRAIAKEVKRLVLRENYHLADIVLVVRQRASYAETIARVMREESLPCNLEWRIDADNIPGLRAALKLFGILEQLSIDDADAPRISDLADLIKSEYFRLNDQDLNALSSKFDAEFAELLRDTENSDELRSKKRYRIGIWDADALENAFAYVGSELRVSDWLTRAGKLIKELPGAEATRELLNIDPVEHIRDPDEADQIENAETAKVDSNDAPRKRRPSRDIHPATLAWTSLVIQKFAETILTVDRNGTPTHLRFVLMNLLERFRFSDQVTRPMRSAVADEELAQAMLNYHSLEALRRAFTAAIKSMSEPPALAGGPLTNTPPIQPGGPLTNTPSDGDASELSVNNQEALKGPPAHAVAADLAAFIGEVRRCLSSQSVPFGAADRGGLRVLEATDVRGLRFRVVFIAGLVEGGFPLRASRDWIYPHEERERLKTYGLTLEDISPATLLKEEHYFYQAACRATDRLYLSRPLQLEDDSETVASYYLDELRRAVAPLEIKAETIRRDYEGEYLERVSTANELNLSLVRQEERHNHRGPKDNLLTVPRIKRLLALSRNDGLLSASAFTRIEIERERAGPGFGKYDGQITDPHLIALLNRKFGDEFVHSASGLSIYGNCAYRFFGQRVLKLEPRGEAALDLQAIDAGKLLHDILRRFFERHRRERLTEQNRESLQQELRDLADEVFDEHEGLVPPLNTQIWKLDREIRKILLDQVLLYELGIQESASAHGVLPA